MMALVVVIVGRRRQVARRARGGWRTGIEREGGGKSVVGSCSRVWSWLSGVVSDLEVEAGWGAPVTDASHGLAVSQP